MGCGLLYRFISLFRLRHNKRTTFTQQQKQKEREKEIEKEKERVKDNYIPR